MERLAVEAIPRGDRVQGGGDEVDGHDVDDAALEADQRRPLRDRVTQALLDEAPRYADAVVRLDMTRQVSEIVFATRA